MGDRCHLRVDVYREDRDALIERIGKPTSEEECPQRPHLVELQFDEWAAFGDLGDAGGDGLRFVAYNSAGIEYGAEITAAFGGQIAACDSVNDCPAITLSSDGTARYGEAPALNVIRVRNLVLAPPPQPARVEADEALKACDECEHLGYIFSTIDREPGMEIECCDNCRLYPSDDAAAVAFVRDLEKGRVEAMDMARELLEHNKPEDVT